MQKDTELPNRSNGTKVPRRVNGGGMTHHYRSTDVDNLALRAKFVKVVQWAISLIAIGFFFGTYAWRLNAVECKTNMLVDVIVYKKPPEQPKC